ncbi:MAG: PQQ-dependent sugar dehydrogenase [Rhizobiaceae bacterium]
MQIENAPNGSGFESEVIANGLSRPITFDIAQDGRIFVAEQDGRIVIIEEGEVTSTFLDISDEVNSFRDRGLTSLKLDPDFSNNGHIFFQYTVELDTDNPDAENYESEAGGKIVRVTVDQNDPGKADLSTLVTVLDGHEMSHATHSVGDIDFDKDGNLIFSWGDGGFREDLRLAAQDINSVQGKLFRIDPDTFEGVEENPFYDDENPDSIASKVWAYGIRNSWKINVDEVTGDVYLGEVTDDGPEEINVVRADGSSNLNLGWPYYEGDVRTEYGTLPDNFTYESPYIALPHINVGNAGDAIMAGNRYFGDQYPEIYDGRYFFANTSTGAMYTADEEGNFVPFGAIGEYQWTVDLKEGPDGNLWGLKLFPGELFKIVSTGESTNNDPEAVAQIDKTASETPFEATLDASNSFDPDSDPLTFGWDFDGDGNIDATGATATNTYDQLGKTQTILTVSDDKGGVDTQLLEVTIGPDSSPDTNLAFGKVAIQSGTSDGGLASRAVDGSTQGNFTDGSVSKTDVNRSSLWEVDLGTVGSIGNIEIYPQTNGQPLVNFFVLVSEVPFSSNNLAAVRTDPGVVEFHVTSEVDMVEILEANVTGRYVRIQLESLEDSLALAEVRVLESGETLFFDEPGIVQVLTGTSQNDVFVINSSIEDYGYGNRLSDDAVIVWSNGQSDILTGFEKIRFNDQDVSLQPNPADKSYNDVPNVIQHLTGTDGLDQFVINANSEDYDWGQTQDLAGYVVYGQNGHDLLYGFETVIFNNETILLDRPGSVTELNDPSATQFMNGSGESDRFLVQANSTEYSIAPTLSGDGHVIWNEDGHDILTDVEEVVFFDRTIDLSQPNDGTILDIPGLVQHVQGTSQIETFKINGNSQDYQIAATLDQTGYVVWNEDGHDLLYNIEFVEFNDETEELA